MSEKKYEWTQEPPTVPGWYWFRFFIGRDPPRVVHIEAGAEGLTTDGGFPPTYYEGCGEWAGPIEVPK